MLEFIVSTYLLFMLHSDVSTHTHWRLCVLCLSTTLDPACAAVPWLRRVLSCSGPIQRAGLAGGGVRGEEGPHP